MGRPQLPPPPNDEFVDWMAPAVSETFAQSGNAFPRCGLVRFLTNAGTIRQRFPNRDGPGSFATFRSSIEIAPTGDGPALMLGEHRLTRPARTALQHTPLSDVHDASGDDCPIRDGPCSKSTAIAIEPRGSAK